MTGQRPYVGNTHRYVQVGGATGSGGKKALGAPEQAEIVAAVGPHIEGCCFEVGDDVAAQLAACSSLGERALIRGGARARVDLRRIIHAQLEAAGIAAGAIDDVPGCTVCDRDRFFSYRRDGQVGGRLLSAIAVRG